MCIILFLTIPDNYILFELELINILVKFSNKFGNLDFQSSK